MEGYCSNNKALKWRKTKEYGDVLLHYWSSDGGVVALSVIEMANQLQRLIFSRGDRQYMYQGNGIGQLSIVRPSSNSPWWTNVVWDTNASYCVLLHNYAAQKRSIKLPPLPDCSRRHQSCRRPGACRHWLEPPLGPRGHEQQPDVQKKCLLTVRSSPASFGHPTPSLHGRERKERGKGR